MDRGCARSRRNRLRGSRPWGARTDSARRRSDGAAGPRRAAAAARASAKARAGAALEQAAKPTPATTRRATTGRATAWLREGFTASPRSWRRLRRCVWNAVARQSTLSTTSLALRLRLSERDVLDVDDAVELTDAVEELRDLVELAPTSVSLIGTRAKNSCTTSSCGDHPASFTPETLATPCTADRNAGYSVVSGRILLSSRCRCWRSVSSARSFWYSTRSACALASRPAARRSCFFRLVDARRPRRRRRARSRRPPMSTAMKSTRRRPWRAIG